jgi:ribonuclease HI
MLHIFTDSSVDPILKKGIGCYLLFDGSLNDEIDIQIQNERLNYLKLVDTSSTRAEMETFKYIMSELQTNGTLSKNKKITIYTDCQRIVNLFEEKSYPSDHTHAELYKELLSFIEKFNLNIVKIKGHSKNKTQVEDIMFSLVDKNSRNVLRAYRDDEAWWNS